MALRPHSTLCNPFNVFSSFHDDMRRLNSLMRSFDHIDSSISNNESTTTMHPNYCAKLREDGSQLIELEMPGVKKENIQIELDHDGRVIVVTGNRYRDAKLFSDIGTEQNGKQHDKDKEKKIKPSHIYKWKGHVHGQASVEDVQAEHLGDGILRVLIKSRKEKAGPVRIEIMDN